MTTSSSSFHGFKKLNVKNIIHINKNIKKNLKYNGNVEKLLNFSSEIGDFSGNKGMEQAQLKLHSSGVDKELLIRSAGRHGVSGLTVCLFGGSSYVGEYIVSRLGRSGTRVVVPHRDDGTKIRELKVAGEPGQILLNRYDLKDVDSIYECVKDVDVVINCIGANEDTRNYTMHDANVKSIHQIANVCKQAGIDNFVHLSALGADPDSRSDFFKTKYEGEEVLKEILPHATILRPAPIFGLQDRFVGRFIDLMWQFPFSLIPAANPHQLISPVFVEDVATAAVLAMTDTSTNGQTYSLTGPKEYENEAFLDYITHEMGIYPRKLSNPIGIKALTMSSKYSPPRFKLYTPEDHARSFTHLIKQPQDKGLDELGIIPTQFSRVIGQLIDGKQIEIPYRVTTNYLWKTHFKNMM